MRKILTFSLTLLILPIFLVNPGVVRAVSNLGPWQIENTLNGPLFYHDSIAIQNFLYTFGGSNGVDHLSTIERAQIQTNGVLSKWQVLPPLTISRQHAAVAASDSYIYVSGGEEFPYGGAVDSIESAKINVDGSFGTWNIVSHMPSPREHHRMVSAHGFLYIIGGFNSDISGSADVERSKINIDGTLGPWVPVSPMVIPRVTHYSVSYNDYIYSLGGEAVSDFQNLTSVERAKIKSDGSLENWELENSFAQPRGFLGAALVDSFIYVAGGSGPCSLNTVERVPINPDGTLGQWEYQNSMISDRKGMTLAAAQGHLYAIGGGQECSGSIVYDTVESAALPVIPPPPPPPPPGPNPVVVIPGFGGSFSTKEFVLHQDSTDYHDWVMLPAIAPNIYNPILNAMQTSFYLQNHKVFYFPYDFTKSISITANWLNDFLQNEVIANNPAGTKVNIVGHSMGGLVARYCFEKITGCKDKIGQIVTAGTPHQGAVDDYFFWEGADFKDLDPLTKYGGKLLLHLDGFPKWNEVQIIQENIVGAKDFLPVFDYITGKPYSSLSTVGQNPILKTDLPWSTDFGSRTLALSGNKPNSTSQQLSVSPANKKESDNGFWIDGNPKVVGWGMGDGTVLASSANVPGATNNSYNVNHADYLNTYEPIRDILQFLGLSPIGPFSATGTTSTLLIYSDGPLLKISSKLSTGESLSQPDGNVLFINNVLKPIRRQISVSSPVGGNFIINGWYSDNQNNDVSAAPINVSLFPGEKKTVILQFN